MSIKSTGLGKEEKRTKRAHTRNTDQATSQERPRLLHDRKGAAWLLSCSIMTLIRLEERGVLRPMKLTPGCDNSKTFYTDENIQAVARGDAVALAEGGDDA
jgi:hypothetical protein